MRVAEGANYSIKVESAVATLRVWKRSDLSFDEGARLGTEILDHIRRFAGDDAIHGFVMDLREGPGAHRHAYPRRARAGRRRVRRGGQTRWDVLSEVQRATLEQRLSNSAPTRGRFFSDDDPARRWAAGESRVRARLLGRKQPGGS